MSGADAASGAGAASDAGAGPVGDRSRQVRSLVEECLRRVEDDGPAVFEEVCARHPDLAPDIRARLAMLHAAGLLGIDAGGAGALPGAMPEAMPERLGEFRLLARLGGGGMGVVYLAEQTSLQRRVALKLPVRDPRRSPGFPRCERASHRPGRADACRESHE